MIIFTLAFLLGDLFLQQFSHLPGLSGSLFFYQQPLLSNSFSVLFLLSIFYLFTKKWNYWQILCCGFLCGFIWSYHYAASILTITLPVDFANTLVEARGEIISVPETKSLSFLQDKNQQTDFIFAIKKLKSSSTSTIVNYKKPLNTRVVWRNDNNKKLNIGDEWILPLKLKSIHGTQNPGGFDFEAWALENNLRATAYVVNNHYVINNKLSAPQFLSSHRLHHPIHFIRQKVQEKLMYYLPHSATAPWILALILGERKNINAQFWQVLRNTGTNHLMVVGGLHIGILAGFVAAFANFFWRRVSKFPLILPAQHASLIFAWIAAFIYSFLAGFSIPTQRAFIMLSIFVLTSLMHKKINHWHAWTCALFIVLLINPSTVLSGSFWLSFATIALIIYGMSGRLAARGWWWRFGRMQWVIGLGLIPFTLIFFQECSLISFIANSFAIPFLSFFILPFCLLGASLLFILPSIGCFLLNFADKSLAILWKILTWLAQLQWTTWHYAIPNQILFAILLLAILFLLLPRGMPGRYLSLIWIAPIFLFHQSKPTSNAVNLTLLDVGQGLSAIVQTKHHVLVYDAGAKYNDHHDMGQSVVLPYLYYRGINNIDKLIISHADNDHSGGAQALMKNLKINSIKTSVPNKIFSMSSFKDQSISYCLAGESWNWDGVKFSFLYPSREDLHLDNDSSCVLRIDNGKHIILLTGDIEKYAEKKLLTLPAKQLVATILIAPHHGSKTSAINEFVNAVHPQIVLYAVGYHNRYHFPHASVIAKYAAIFAKQLDSIYNGAMEFKLDNALTMNSYRLVHHRYWMDD